MNRILRIIGIVIGILLILPVIGIVVVFVQSNAKMNQTWDVEVVSVDVPDEPDEEMLAEGERLFLSRGCGDCHGENGSGTIFFDDPAIGIVPAPNLTSGEGGVGQFYTTEDYIRAIQHGVRPDGTSLIIMPSQDWQQMREEELVPLLVYIHSLEPVDNVLPDFQPGPIGRVLLTIGGLQMSAELIDHENAGLVDLDAGATVEYGAYLAVGCTGCHGMDFAGGMDAGAPGGILSANLTFHEDGLASWSLDDFMTTVRTGIRPDGTELDATEMPYGIFTSWTDEEIEAVYLYLQTLEPVLGN